jgi:hypothetical protein
MVSVGRSGPRRQNDELGWRRYQLPKCQLLAAKTESQAARKQTLCLKAVVLAKPPPLRLQEPLPGS